MVLKLSPFVLFLIFSIGYFGALNIADRLAPWLWLIGGFAGLPLLAVLWGRARPLASPFGYTILLITPQFLWLVRMGLADDRFLALELFWWLAQWGFVYAGWRVGRNLWLSRLKGVPTVGNRNKSPS